MVARSIGHNQIIENIGAGGMGEVYRARDESDQVLRALRHALRR